MKFSDIVDLITAAAVIFAGIQIYINRKQLFLSTITKCISDFRRLKGLSRETVDVIILTKYIDISSEELFYFKHNYLPKIVAIEWVDGMIDFMPITSSGIVVNKDECISELANSYKKYFDNFPRLKHALNVTGNYDFKLIYDSDYSDQDSRMRERRRLVNEILRNNDKFKYF
jgi:hypothetical protein